MNVLNLLNVLNLQNFHKVLKPVKPLKASDAVGTTTIANFVYFSLGYKVTFKRHLRVGGFQPRPGQI